MNYTTNYNLPQWEETDVVTREDVNGAMSAIDSAIANASPLVKLLDYTSPSATSQLNIDVSGIDFSQYWQIFMYFDPGTSYARMRLNGVSSGYKRYALGGTSATNVQNINLVRRDTHIRFFPVSHTYVALTTLTTASSLDSNDYVAPVTWAELTTINLYEGTMPAGTRVVIYGIRK